MGEPGNLVLPEEWSGNGPHGGGLQVTCYLSAVTINPLLRTLEGIQTHEPTNAVNQYVSTHTGIMYLI